MEWVDEFLSNPEQVEVMVTGLPAAATAVYFAYKNDFGAADENKAELKDYLEDTEIGFTSPISTWKAREYSNELERREEEEAQLADPEYEENDSRFIRYADD